MEHEGVIGTKSGEDVFGTSFQFCDDGVGDSLGKALGYALAEIWVADGNGGKSGTTEGGLEAPAGCFDFWQFGHSVIVARLASGG